MTDFKDDLKTILAKNPQDWTQADRLVIAKANVTLGRQVVKDLRNQLNDIELVPVADTVVEEKTHETLIDMTIKGE